MRRLFALAIVASLLCPALLAGPAIAAPDPILETQIYYPSAVKTPPKGTVETDHHTGGCQDVFTDWDWVAAWRNGSLANHSGSQGYIGPTTYFQDCHPWFTDAAASSSAWVSLFSESRGPNAIYQIGIIDCHLIYNNDGSCSNTEGTSGPRFFWAVGGCNGKEPSPDYINPATYGSSATAADFNGFMVQRTANYFHAYIDFAPNNGVWVEITEAAVSRGSSWVNCWDDDVLSAENAYERHDEGDSAGDGTHPLNIEFNRYSVLNQSGWNLWTQAQLCNYNDTGGEGHTASCIIQVGGGTNHMWISD